MRVESRPNGRNRWRVEQRAGRFYGSAGINRTASDGAKHEIVLALHDGSDEYSDRTFRLFLNVEEASQLRVALGKAIKQLAEIEAEIEAQEAKENPR